MLGRLRRFARVWRDRVSPGSDHILCACLRTCIRRPRRGTGWGRCRPLPEELSPVSTNERLVHTTPADVWEVLADGWLYPLWVVGATRMREVEPAWPDVGSRLFHSVGAWPLTIDDSTSVVACEPGRRLELRARAWPAGEAEVVLELEPADDVEGGTLVRIHEDVVSGPGRLLPPPLRHLQLAWRNTETLRRLALVAERRG